MTERVAIRKAHLNPTILDILKYDGFVATDNPEDISMYVFFDKVHDWTKDYNLARQRKKNALMFSRIARKQAQTVRQYVLGLKRIAKDKKRVAAQLKREQNVTPTELVAEVVQLESEIEDASRLHEMMKNKAQEFAEEQAPLAQELMLPTMEEPTMEEPTMESVQSKIDREFLKKFTYSVMRKKADQYDKLKEKIAQLESIEDLDAKQKRQLKASKTRLKNLEDLIDKYDLQQEYLQQEKLLIKRIDDDNRKKQELIDEQDRLQRVAEYNKKQEERKRLSEMPDTRSEADLFSTLGEYARLIENGEYEKASDFKENFLYGTKEEKAAWEKMKEHYNKKIMADKQYKRKPIKRAHKFEPVHLRRTQENIAKLDAEKELREGLFRIQNDIDNEYKKYEDLMQYPHWTDDMNYVKPKSRLSLDNKISRLKAKQNVVNEELKQLSGQGKSLFKKYSPMAIEGLMN